MNYFSQGKTKLLEMVYKALLFWSTSKPSLHYLVHLPSLSKLQPRRLSYFFSIQQTQSYLWTLRLAVSSVKNALSEKPNLSSPSSIISLIECLIIKMNCSGNLTERSYIVHFLSETWNYPNIQIALAPFSGRWHIEIRVWTKDCHS